MNRLANPLAPRGFALPEKTSQIKVWIREARGLDDDVVVSVTELVCRKDGCPDIETVIGIMRPKNRDDPASQGNRRCDLARSAARVNRSA